MCSTSACSVSLRALCDGSHRQACHTHALETRSCLPTSGWTSGFVQQVESGCKPYPALTDTGKCKPPTSTRFTSPSNRLPATLTSPPPTSTRLLPTLTRLPSALSRLSIAAATSSSGAFDEVEVVVEKDEDDDVEDDWDDDTFSNQAPAQRPSVNLGLTERDLNRWRQKPVEEKYRIQVERGISEERKKELGVQFWSKWTSPGPCAYYWEWRADEQVFISKGTLYVTPQGCAESAEFRAGDLVRFPKWMLAELEIGGSYEQHYRFRAYGDDN